MLANRLLKPATNGPLQLNFGAKTEHRPQASLFASSAKMQGKRLAPSYVPQGASKDVRSLRK